MKLTEKRDEIVAGGVALAAFAASAQHIFHVTELAGNPALVAALHPAGIDGLIYIGIRAMQRGRRWAGGAAVAYGAAYSLTFNAASYGGITMPVWALAACMPLAMFFAFLIVHSGGHAAELTEPLEVPVRVIERLPDLLPIVPLVHKVETPELETPETPALIAPAAPVRRQLAAAPTSGGPARGWDVRKVVLMLQQGEDESAILDATGVPIKSLTRTRFVVRAIASGEADAAIVSPGNRSARLVAEVRKIMEEQ